MEERLPVPSETLLERITGLSVSEAERVMLQVDQVECPVYHHLAPGLYIREVHFPAGSIIIGHEQRFEQMNVFLKGRVLMFGENGEHTELVAPMTFIGPPGRKMGLIIEDVVWQNIYPTDLTDIAELEAHFLVKSEDWLADQKERFEEATEEAQLDRDDYLEMCADVGVTPEKMTQESETVHDMIAMPLGWGTVGVFDSPIHGKGLFATVSFTRGQTICPAVISGKRTPAGRYINHSAVPNAALGKDQHGNLWVIATRFIEGCRGGQLGDEITFDYRQSSSVAVSKEELCQVQQ